MTIIRENSGKQIAFVKGAPDILLGDCTKIELAGATRNLLPKDREYILNANNHMANDAMRVLGLAYKELDRRRYKLSGRYN